MKKIISGLFATAILLALPLTAMAADFKMSNSPDGDVTVSANENTKNAVMVGSNIDISGSVSKDLYSLGGDIVLKGNVENSATILGDKISVEGNIGNILKAAGSNIDIAGNISEDVFAAGSVINLTSSSKISGSVYTASSNLKISGIVNGDVRAVAGDVVVSGTINGNLIIKDCETLTIEDGAIITGSVKYSSKTEATISPNARVGSVEFTKSESRYKLAAIATATFWAGILSGLAFLLVVFYLFRRHLQEVVNNIAKKPLPSIGAGTLFLIVVPIVVVALLFTVAGIKLAIFLGLLFALITMIAVAVSSLFLGAAIDKLVKKNTDFEITIVNLFYGFLALVILGLIPGIGGFAVFVLFLFSLGASVLYVYDKMMKRT